LRVLIIDGYNDEPGGLGVPPYIDVYPRLVSGAIWLARRDARIDYVTVDQFRKWERIWLQRSRKYDYVVVIAGVVVPGKYIGGTPASPEELVRWARSIKGPTLILVGPAARWGIGLSGGGPSYPPWVFKKEGFHVLVKGDPEEFFYSLALNGLEKADPHRIRHDYKLYDKAIRLGARIVMQHPRLGRGLIAEIETYRGCARWITGGCSFCVEPLRGRPITRDPEGILGEVESLYIHGVRAFRLGRQADILVYGSKDLGVEEWPKPDPSALRRLFQGIRNVAPNLEVLHIDNVNPGTIARHIKEAEEALKIIVKYHTEGDVAAMGVETADEKVSRLNNLNTTPEEALLAIRMVNKIGNIRGRGGLPHLLPGINFILGLPGETRETYYKNKLFLEKILNEGLLVRRVNVRRLLVLPLTRVSRMKHGVRSRLEKHAKSFRFWVRNKFEKVMIRRIAPPGTILYNLWVEDCHRGVCYAF